MSHSQYRMVAYKTGITTGTQVTSSSAAANVAIPVDASNGNPKRIILQCASGNVHVKLLTSTSSTAATAGDLMVGTVPIVLDASGAAFVSYIQETAGSKLQISPVEQ